jgi:drug/metabolite transporter (DMT)-like permease
VTISQTIYAFIPVLTAIFAHFLISERLNRVRSIGIFLGLIGTLIVVALPLVNGTADGNLTGNLLILAGALSWAAYPVIAKSVQNYYTPLVLTTTMMIPATIISGLFVLVDWASGRFIPPTPLIWSFMIYSGVITVVYYLLTHRLIQKVSSLMGTLVLYVQPITAFGWAALLLGEKLTPGLVLGATLTIGGAYLVNKNSKG